MKEKYITFCKKHKFLLTSVSLLLMLVIEIAAISRFNGHTNPLLGGDTLKLFYDGKSFTVNKSDVASQTFLNLKILGISDSINIDAIPTSPDFKGDINKTIPGKDGLHVNTDKLTVLIADNIKKPPVYPLPIPVIRTFAGKYSDASLASIRKQAAEFSKRPITITVKGINFTLSTQDLKDLMILKEKPDPRNPKKVIPVLRLDEVALNKKLGAYAETVELSTHSEYNYHEARIAIYSQFFGNYRKIVEIPSGASKELAMKVLGTETTAPDATQKIAYLTFDDGPNSIYHPMILDILKKYNVKATFFLIGNNSIMNNEITKRTLAEGHKIGNHTLTHPFLPSLKNDAIFTEINETDKVLQKITGEPVNMFRPPYGGVNLVVKRDVDTLKLKMFLWDVDPRDWSEPAVNELVRRVVENTKNGSDILMHSNHLVTAKALPQIIEKLQAEGYTFGLLN